MSAPSRIRTKVRMPASNSSIILKGAHYPNLSYITNILEEYYQIKRFITVWKTKEQSYRSCQENFSYEHFLKTLSRRKHEMGVYDLYLDFIQS